MIKTLLLRNGLEVVADVTQHADKLRLNKPFKIIIASVPSQGKGGSVHVTNLPMMVPMVATCAEDFIDLPDSDIAATLTATREIATAYIKRTTGLEVADASMLGL